MSKPSDDELREVEQRIEWVLADPGMSAWLKSALRTALDHDPVQILNDLEMLRILLHPEPTRSSAGGCVYWIRPRCARLRRSVLAPTGGTSSSVNRTRMRNKGNELGKTTPATPHALASA